MSRRNHSSKGLRWLAAGVLLVLALGIAASAIVDSVVSQSLGPPSPQLGASQRLLYAWRLLPHLDALQRANVPGTSEVRFEIEPGETVSHVASALQKNQLIPDAQSFRDYLVYSGLDSSLRSGAYRVPSGLSPVQLAFSFQSGEYLELTFSTIPGWRSEEVAASLSSSGLSASPVEFLSIVRNPPASLVPPSLGPLTSLEGFLFPGQYPLPRDAGAGDVIQVMLAQFDRKVDSNTRVAISAQGLTLTEAVTLASIVEKEAILDSEKPLIASVFLNRLRAGMPLQSDATVQYALANQPGAGVWWKSPLSASDLKVDSPFNTYLHPGLPPSPICNPGLPSIEAVAHPASTDYLYFRAKCDGSGEHAFSKTYEEQLANACP